MRRFDPSLYLVTDPELCRKTGLASAVDLAVAGGVTLVQLRDKAASPRELVELARELLELLRPKGIPLIVNDHLEVALEAGADGLHLGRTDGNPTMARNKLGKDAILGVSLESTMSLSRLPLDDIDYVAVSPVFPTTSKVDTQPAFGLDGLRAVTRACRKPVVAIGGIHHGNLGEVLRAGAGGVAVISAILGSDDIQTAAMRLKQAIVALQGSASRKSIPARVLTIAGSDSGGGAGIQADLKTFEAIGGYGMSAVTVLTAQNTRGVRSVFPATPEFVVDQVRAVVEDIGVDAIKLGMLYSSPIIEAVAEYLASLRMEKIVVDPVMVAKGGTRLLEESAVEVLKEKIFPLAGLITPNIPEAETLTGMKIASRSEMEVAATRLLEYCRRVVVKGGHLDERTSSPDLFATRDELAWMESSRIKTANTHGTGCTFSAAVAAYVALGDDWKDAIVHAKTYLLGAIEHGADRHLGSGCGPVHHGWRRER